MRTLAPHLPDIARATWIAALAHPMRRADVTSERRIAAFLGQCAVESAGFLQLEEDLNYSAARLCAVWPAHFPNPEAASACARQPERLANQVYAGRLGNGSAASGDGWRFRGRGLIQLTGRANYERFARSLGISLDAAVAYAAQPQGAAASAAWFWAANNLNTLADAWSINAITCRINGGLEGAAERARLCKAALHVLGET